MTLIIRFLSLLINHWNFVCCFFFPLVFKLLGFFFTIFFPFHSFQTRTMRRAAILYALVFHKPPSTFWLHNKSMDECGFDRIVVEILLKHWATLLSLHHYFTHSFIHIPEYYLLKLKKFSFNSQTIHFPTSKIFFFLCTFSCILYWIFDEILSNTFLMTIHSSVYT